MTPQLQNILDLIKQSAQLNDADKAAIEKAIKETDKSLEIANFKLDRTEKVKRTTAILLEETIAELEQKRKAVEAQNRELEIESSLERVRAVAMGMTKPDDLLAICETVFKELQKLGFNELRNSMINIHNDEKGSFLNYDFSDFAGAVIANVDYNIYHSIQKLVAEARSSKDAFIEYVYSGQELIDWKAVRKKNGEYDDPRVENITALYYYFYSIGIGSIGISAFSAIDAERLELLKRFRNVFDLAYRRYIDITKAEAQAREAKIEAALEKVRSRSLAMHHSDELREVIGMIYIMLSELKVKHDTIAIQVFDFENKSSVLWPRNTLQNVAPKVMFPYDEDIMKEDTCHRALWEAMATGKSIINKVYTKQQKDRWFEYIFANNDYTAIEEHSRQFLLELETFTVCFFPEKYSGLYAESWDGTKYSDDNIDVLKRAARVFEQAYVRFLDLQKAEAQAREAKIEAALERVRSRSMAMHKSDELKEVIKVVLEQFAHLNINVGHAGFYIDYRVNDDMHIWLADPNIEPFYAIIPYFDTPTWNSFLEAKRNGTTLHTDLLNFEEKNNFYNSLFKLFTVPDEAKKFYLECKGLAVSTVLLDNVGLYIENFDAVAYSDEENNILMRFGKVFQQTYTRFHDLQKAEAQAREAQIEAALERTRTQSMLMQHSKELDDTLRVFHQQILLLGINSAFSFLWLPDEDKNRHIFWAAWGEDQNDSTIFKSKAINYPLDRNEPATAQCLVDWKSEKPVHSYNVPPAQVENYFAAWAELFEGAEKLKPEYFPNGLNYVEAFMKYGCFGVMIENELPEDEKKILLRFAIEFERTYTRFLDLQKAEAQAREAQIEAALEKVRSRTMAMQSSDELADAAYVLFEQLNHLGIVHERINIGIVNEENQTIDFWVTGQGGNRITTRFSGRISEPTTLVKAYTAWKKGEKSLVIDQQGEDLQRWLTFMDKEIKIPFDKKYLHNRRVQTAGFFSKGMLVVTSPEPLQSEAIYLLEKFSGVFDLTYTRFNDLKIAEAHALQAEQDLIAIKEAKQKAEEALTELQLTQKQLIQSEKMASLGELTAGIAHEIQNPLNFVNNFSDVSKELLDEMKAELATGNVQQAAEIADDVIGNLEKILHHGKRADGIVKGMLQHSRSSTGQKELTDINALTDEYLRLAYHGLRAKDKSFNAKLETDFDASIGKIEIVPQEIGRVILNLINNAFYAAPLPPEGGFKDPNYKHVPTVWVNTKKMGDKVLISVRDNGPGIPQKILDKIFQPFFTTKPTGQGTGLGLSLSYDIVKAHGGELKVKTKEGEGSEFIISLSI